MTANYEIHIADAFGNKLAIIRDFTDNSGASLDMLRTVNNFGALSFTVSANYSTDLFKKDGRVFVYRSINGASPYLEGETVYFIRRVARFLDEQGRSFLKIRALDANHLLNRRIVAYAAGTSQASKADFADDMMKDLIRENLGSSATDTNRDWSSYITVQADVGAAQNITKSFSRRNVLTVLQELAQASTIAGTYLAFDMIATSESTLEFRTYTGQRGIDHSSDSSDAVILGPEFGSLTNIERSYDWSDEFTYVYAGGQGELSDRLVAPSSDSTLIGESPFGRIEEFHNANMTSNSTALVDEADARLREGRPRRSFTATFLDTPGVPYGIRIGFGDIVTASFLGETIDCRIDSVGVSVNAGREQISIQLRSEVQ